MLNDIILKRKSEIEQLRDGMDEPFGIITYLRTHSSLSLKYVFPSPEEVKLKAEAVQKVISPLEPIDEREANALRWFFQYIHEIGKEEDTGRFLFKISFLIS